MGEARLMVSIVIFRNWRLLIVLFLVFRNSCFKLLLFCHPSSNDEIWGVRLGLVVLGVVGLGWVEVRLG